MTLFSLAIAFFKYYVDARIDPIMRHIDAKIDPVGRDVATLVQYMVSHEGKINRLEERTKNL